MMTDTFEKLSNNEGIFRYAEILAEFLTLFQHNKARVIPDSQDANLVHMCALVNDEKIDIPLKLHSEPHITLFEIVTRMEKVCEHGCKIHNVAMPNPELTSGLPILDNLVTLRKSVEDVCLTPDDTVKHFDIMKDERLIEFIETVQSAKAPVGIGYIYKNNNARLS